MKRVFHVETTHFGTARMTRDQLYQLHREVSKAASLARQDDPKFVANQRQGKAAAAGRWL